MRVDKRVLDSVFFLCGHNEGENYQIGGTAFGVVLEREGKQHAYLVTARHCITKAKAKYTKLFLRLNTKAGEIGYVEVPFDWFTPDDPAVDVAVLPAPRGLPARFQIQVHHESLFATNAVVQEHEIGIGDSVLIIGLFSKRAGRKRNVPIVRTGTIAAMPDEPLEDTKTGLWYNAYLLEVRSIGGLSGSPVVAYLGYDRNVVGKVNREGKDFLLGLVRGHWDYKPSESADGLEDASRRVRSGEHGDRYRNSHPRCGRSSELGGSNGAEEREGAEGCR